MGLTELVHEEELIIFPVFNVHLSKYFSDPIIILLKKIEILV